MTMSTEPTPPDEANAADFDDATSATLDTLEDVLDAIRERLPETPQWEFGEGLMTALLCTRRPVGEDEWVPFLFGSDADEVFATPAERTRFLMGWMERESQLRAALTAQDASRLTPDELKEVLLQNAIYAGVPAANTAFNLAQNILREVAEQIGYELAPGDPRQADLFDQQAG